MPHCRALDSITLSKDQFLSNGFAVVPAVVSSDECAELASKVSPFDSQSGGTRCLLRETWCRELSDRLLKHSVLNELLFGSPVAVQYTYFEKSAARNWLVAPHQDLSIPVATRVDHPAHRGWSEKEGTTYVQPPTDVLEALIAVRLHLDACTTDDGPLRVARGTHRLGRIRQADASGLMKTAVACPVESGAALVMRPLLLHASSKASGTSLRRVLHFVFGPRTLPNGLKWALSDN